MISRAVAMEAVAHAIAHHYDNLPREIEIALRESGQADRQRRALAVGKAALATARALGPVEVGLAVAPHDDGAPLPAGWTLLVSSHPIVDERAVVAGDAAIELFESAPADRVIVALISGGASALMESPLCPLPELARITSALMRLGVPIAELNVVRRQLSAIKGGKLAARSVAPVVTLAISDVIGDDIETIGSAPTVIPRRVDADAYRKSQRSLALRVLKRHEIRIPRLFGARVELSAAKRSDYARVIVPMGRFARSVHANLAGHDPPFGFVDGGFAGEVDSLAYDIGNRVGHVVRWGEPTLEIKPDHGAGGRMQHLALEVAQYIAGKPRSLFAIGSDGIDGPPPADRPAPAGAFVDGTTWEAIRAAGLDPKAALTRCDSGTALAAVGALVITGPTGINHADLVIVG